MTMKTLYFVSLIIIYGMLIDSWCFTELPKFYVSRFKLYQLNADSDIPQEGKIAVIIIDHGSKLSEANINLEKIVSNYKITSSEQIVEAAHMELAEPSISTAFRRCVDQGATLVICHPFFLSKGKHVMKDIPFLVNEAAKEFPDIKYKITEPLGNEMNGIIELIKKSVNGF